MSGIGSAAGAGVAAIVSFGIPLVSAAGTAGAAVLESALAFVITAELVSLSCVQALVSMIPQRMAAALDVYLL